MEATKLEKRMATERLVVGTLLAVAKKHGYACTSVDAGEERVPCSTDEEAMATVFSVDESLMRFKHSDEPRSHTAFIVLGNDGWDAIADCSMGGKWDAVMAEMDAFTDTLEEMQG